MNPILTLAAVFAAVLFAVFATAILCLIGQARMAGGLRRTRFTSAKFTPSYTRRFSWRHPFGERLVIACNAILAPQWHKTLTRKLDNAVSTRYLLMKSGATAGVTADIAGATDIPIGVITDEGAAGDYKDIQPLDTAESTLTLVASGAINADTAVYADANGKVQADPTAVAGLYVRVGRAITATAADGDLVEIIPSRPVLVRVVTATGAAAVADVVTLLKTITAHSEVKFI